MRFSSLFLAIMMFAGIANAQRFDNHKVYLATNGVGSRTVKVKPASSFTIKKDNRISWAKYKIGNGEVTFSATANTTTNNRSCDFVLIDKDGKPVDTLEVIQTGKASTSAVRNASKLAGSTTSTKPKTTTTTRKSSTSSSRSSYGGQCAATTKKGRRCTRQASSGSIYCWQHK